jgi:signal transduction histidine kinase
MNSLSNIESGSRGYVITGKVAFLDPYFDGMINVHVEISHLDNLTRDQPSQHVRVSELKKITDERFLVTKRINETRKLKGFDAAKREVMASYNKEITKKAKTLLSAITTEELDLLSKRKYANELSIRNFERMYIVLMIVIVLIIAFIIVNIFKNQKIKKMAADELRAVNEELESFSYSVSHDLRAPLRAIHGYSKILEEDYYTQLDEDGKKSIGAILRNARKMGELIDDLLSFSRLGRKELSASVLRMNAMVEKICLDLIPPAGDVDLKINALPSAVGDYTLISQVWINLISNGLKFSRTREKTILEIGSRQAAGKNIYYVKDNGAGFDMRFYNKLFGVFQRLHSQEEFEGTGVGLAIVQRIINKHHGEIWAESSVDEGACFYFTLPSTHLN